MLLFLSRLCTYDLWKQRVSWFIWKHCIIPCIVINLRQTLCWVSLLFLCKTHRQFFTPQPSRLEVYCQGRQAGRQLPDFGERISLKPPDRFSPFEVLWNCPDRELCYVIVIYSFARYGLALGPKTCQISYHWVPNISLKLLHGFTPFEVLWNCLNL